jgi:DNA repair protein RadD
VLPNQDPAAMGARTGSGRLVDQHDDNPPHKLSLRPYQGATLAKLEAALVGGSRRILVTLPTGSGKTVIAAAILEREVDKHRRALFLCHRRELITQASRKLHDLGVDHGIILPGFPTRLGERVQVASIATLHARAMRSRAMELPPADLVIVDECHHARARSWRRLIEAYPDEIIIGLTATPCRGDGRGLGAIFEVLIETATVGDLIAAGYLVATRVYAPARPDLTGIRVERGDYAERQLAERVNTGQLVGDIVEHWHRLAERRPTVVFAVDRAHSVHLRDEFRRSGVLAEHVDGSIPLEERDAILAKLASGVVEVVCNCAVLTEGWDCPEVSCIVLARPTKSLGLYRQMTGRSLRPSAGKSDALVLDHAGAVFQHGFAEDPIAWTLSEDQCAENKSHGVRGTYKAPSLTTCPECSAVRFEGQQCPVCNWRRVTKPRSVEIANGELGAVSRTRSVESPSHSSDDILNFFRQLLFIAKERNYKAGWASHKFKEKFGQWPPVRVRSASPMPPDPAVLSWVRSRQIAYARAMDKARPA